MARPVIIGLTLDSEKPGGYSKFPWYAIRENYCSAVEAAGGLPVALPHDPDRVADYLDRLDGLVVTGGAFDIDPALFGAPSRHATVTTKDRRTQFELAVTRLAPRSASMGSTRVAIHAGTMPKATPVMSDMTKANSSTGMEGDALIGT